jgi:hypothetical protein
MSSCARRPPARVTHTRRPNRPTDAGVYSADNGADWCVGAESTILERSFDLSSRPTVLDTITDDTPQPLTLLP